MALFAFADETIPGNPTVAPFRIRDPTSTISGEGDRPGRINSDSYSGTVAFVPERAVFPPVFGS